MLSVFQHGDSADVKPVVHAHWINKDEFYASKHKHYPLLCVESFCSACENGSVKRTRFCPNCGATMDETASL